MARRRRFGFQHGVLTAYEDERLLDPAAARGVLSAILEEEIERPRVGPMRDIVATIQPEQDVIVRADLAESVCVQGAPGTGKTAVGLHRAAYLLYTHRDQLSRQGVLVVGPERALPALHRRRAARARRDRRPADHDRGPRREDPDPAQRAVRRPRRGRRRRRDPQGRRPDGRGAAPRGLVAGAARRPRAWSCRAGPGGGGCRRTRSRRSSTALRARGVRYGAARAMLAQRLAHAVLVKMELAGDSPDDRVQDAVARSRPVKQYVDAVWPAVDPARLVLRCSPTPAPSRPRPTASSPTTSRRACCGPSPPKGPRSRAGRWPTRSWSTRRPTWSSARRSLGHVVADEAQDLSPMMLRAVGRRCSHRLGDRARRPRAGHHPVGHPVLGRRARPPRQAGAHIEQLDPGLPRARRRSSSTPRGCCP